MILLLELFRDLLMSPTGRCRARFRFVGPMYARRRRLFSPPRSPAPHWRRLHSGGRQAVRYVLFLVIVYRRYIAQCRPKSVWFTGFDNDMAVYEWPPVNATGRPPSTPRGLMRDPRHSVRVRAGRADTVCQCEMLSPLPPPRRSAATGHRRTLLQQSAGNGPEYG